MITRVISGGQIGADIAGLRAADACGVETGGTAPKGWRTLHGPNPGLKNYGLVQDGSPYYPPRTRKNVRDSDGTIRFAINFNSPGERATLREVVAADKPCFDVQLELVPSDPPVWVLNPPVSEARKWVEDNRIRTLNVAGNGFATIEKPVEAYLKRLLLE